jgi:putative endonuclease
MPYYSYVLRSMKNEILYKGSTDDIEKRIQTHNAGKVKYSSKHLPWELVLSEEFETRTEAMKREKWYKTGVGREWIKKQLNSTSAG